jgi:ABC-type cobalamin/Fe3+-siderophores transport system ATPase subunit
LCRRATYVFPGRSGSGKSTLIRKLGKGRALSDELVLVYLDGDIVTAASTPFWGELKRGRSRAVTARLRGFFFPRKGDRCFREPLPFNETLRQLLATVLFFARDPGTVQTMLSLASHVAGKVPAWNLVSALATEKEALLSCLAENDGVEEAAA